MSTAIIAAILSGVLALTLFLVFRYERARNARIAERTRARFDALVERVGARIVAHHPHAGMRTVRHTVHYLFHTVLATLLRALEYLEHLIRTVMRVNKERAKRIERRDASSHLSMVAAHKRTAQLSEEEKQEYRERALNGE